MNSWRRGMVRLWIVSSLIWLAGCYFVFEPDEVWRTTTSIEKDIRKLAAGQRKNSFGTQLANFGVSLSAEARRIQIRRYVIWSASGPIALMLVLWAIAGFRRDEDETDDAVVSERRDPTF